MKNFYEISSAKKWGVSGVLGPPNKFNTRELYSGFSKTLVLIVEGFPAVRFLKFWFRKVREV